MKRRNVVRYVLVVFIATLSTLATALLCVTAQTGHIQAPFIAALPIEQREVYENCRL
jgi:hypothetical protein